MTPQEREAMQMALETLVTCRITNEFEPGSGVLKEIDDSITALRAALAQPEKTNQCGEVCERAKLCSVCARGLAQTEQQPAAWINWFDGLAIPHYKELDWSKDKQASRSTPLYTAPPQREWVGLTDEELDEINGSPMRLEHSGLLSFARAIEAKLREKNAL